MKFDPETHHRRYIRLPGYDYSRPGVFFVTLCTFQREEILGAVVDEEMQLSPLGRIVRTEWFHSAGIRKEIQLFKTEFVIMPNHLHGIVWITEDDGVRADGIRPAENYHFPIHAMGSRPNSLTAGADREGARRAPLQSAPRSLEAFIGGFKAAVTSQAGDELNSANIWQRNYYEHIIRNKDELQ